MTATEWCQRYLPRYVFLVSNLICIFQYFGRQAAPALRRTIGFNTQCWTSDVAENLGRYLSCAERAAEGKDFELILAVKMEPRRLVEIQFVVNFRRSVIIV